MEVTGPFTLTLGQETDVSPPNGSSRFTRVVLSNASPYACKVNANGVAQWLQPWSADIYPCSDGVPVQVVPALTTSAQSTNNQVTATWYLDIDPISGNYPAPLTAQAVAITDGTVNLAAGSTVEISGPVSLASGTTVEATISGPVSLASGTSVDVGTIENITAGSITVSNSLGSAGASVQPVSLGVTNAFVTSTSGRTQLVGVFGSQRLRIGLITMYSTFNTTIQVDLQDGVNNFYTVALGTAQSPPPVVADHLLGPGNALYLNVNSGASSGNLRVNVCYAIGS